MRGLQDGGSATTGRRRDLQKVLFYCILFYEGNEATARLWPLFIGFDQDE